MMLLIRKSQMAFDFSKHDEQRTVHAGTRHLANGAVVQVAEHQRRMEITNHDFHINKFKEVASKWGVPAAKDRARSALASAVLSREFGETSESFFDRKPELGNLHKWIADGFPGIKADTDPRIAQADREYAEWQAKQPELTAKYNLDAMHPELVPTVKEVVEKIQRDFGIPRITVNIDDNRRGSLGHAFAENFTLHSGYSELAFEQQNGSSSMTKKLDWVTAHEFGHVIDGIIKDAHGKEGEKNTGYESAIRKIKADHKKDTTNSHLVSIYSQKDNSEYVAEHFADAITNGDNAHPYSKKVYQAMKEWYGKNKYKGLKEAHAGFQKDKEEERARHAARLASMVQPGEHPGNGSIIEDASGNEYLVMMARNSIVNVAPITNGKAEVNRDSIISFSTDRDFMPASESTRYMKLFKTGRNYYEEQEKHLAKSLPLTHLLRKSKNGLTLAAKVDEHGHQIHRWVKEVADFRERLLDHKAAMLNPRSPVRLTDNTPDIYLQLGAQDRPIEISVDAIDKILSSKFKRKDGHELPTKVAKEIPKALYHPMMVFAPDPEPEAGKTRPAWAQNSLVVLTTIEHNNRPLFVVIQMDIQVGGRSNYVHKIASSYDRPEEDVKKWIKKGLLRMMDKGKGFDWLRSNRLYMHADGTSIQSLTPAHTVLFKSQGVKYIIFTPPANEINKSLAGTYLLKSAGLTSRGTVGNFDGTSLLPSGNLCHASDVDWISQFPLMGDFSSGGKNFFRHNTHNNLQKANIPSESTKPAPQNDIKHLPTLLKAARALHGSIDFNGLQISIETGRSRMREWKNPHDGSQGISRMTLPYGYIKRTLGVDGDHYDCFVGPDRSAEYVYIVTTMAAPDFIEVDEQKAFIGCPSAEEAKRVFHASYNNPKFFGSMTEMPFAEFKEQVLATRENPQLLSGDLTKAAKYNQTEFDQGMKDEQEHADVVDGDQTKIARIVQEHLDEDPHYYSKMAKIKKMGLLKAGIR